MSTAGATATPTLLLLLLLLLYWQHMAPLADINLPERLIVMADVKNVYPDAS